MKSDTGVKINHLLNEIGDLTGQGSLYQGLYDQDLLLSNKVCAFCRHALSHPVAASLCRVACRNATVHAMASGEPNFYRCWANLLFISIPVAPHNKCCGGVELGGFCIAGEEIDIRDAVIQVTRAWPNTDPKSFLKHIPSLCQITPSALRGLGTLTLETSLSSGLNSSAFFKRLNEKYLQQRRIAEAFADIRKQETTPPDILGDTYQLLAFLNQKDKPGAMAFVSKYLAKLLMASNWDQTKLKAHVRVLLAVMTSQKILEGTPWPVATSREMRQMLRLEHAATTEESCYEVAEWIQDYFSGTAPTPQDTTPLPERVTDWLQSHFQDRVTLATASRAIGVSASTLVHRLRREAGKTFKELLSEIRLSEAKKLLATTSLGISEIGASCGFFDQSHFTREFKRAINLTPGEFRKLLRVPDEALLQTGLQNLDETAPLATPSKPKGRPHPLTGSRASVMKKAHRSESTTGPGRKSKIRRQSKKTSARPAAHNDLSARPRSAGRQSRRPTRR
jgi:AraC-like DNA-binding protein